MDSDDIEVKYSFNYNGKINVTDLKARVFSIRVDQQDIFYFILEFDPIDLDRNSSPGGLKCTHGKLTGAKKFPTSEIFRHHHWTSSISAKLLFPNTAKNNAHFFPPQDGIF